MSLHGNDNSSASSLATPRPLEDDTTAPPVPQRETVAELLYVAENRSLKALAILSWSRRQLKEEQEKGREREMAHGAGNN